MKTIMYILWFKRALGADEIQIICPDIFTAQDLWDDLIDLGYIPQCPRPQH